MKERIGRWLWNTFEQRRSTGYLAIPSDWSVIRVSFERTELSREQEKAIAAVDRWVAMAKPDSQHQSEKSSIKERIERVIEYLEPKEEMAVHIHREDIPVEYTKETPKFREQRGKHSGENIRQIVAAFPDEEVEIDRYSQRALNEEIEDHEQRVEDTWDKARIEPQYSKLDQFRFRALGMLNRPEDICPLPVPQSNTPLPVLILPSEERSPIQEALNRLFATENSWCGGGEIMGVASHAEWFTKLVAIENEEAGWDLHLMPVDRPSDGCSIHEANTGSDLPYSGCRSVYIPRPHFVRLTILAQDTVWEQLRGDFREIAAVGLSHQNLARDRAQRIAQIQLSSLTQLHDEISPPNDRYWTTPKQWDSNQ